MTKFQFDEKQKRTTLAVEYVTIRFLNETMQQRNLTLYENFDVEAIQIIMQRFPDCKVVYTNGTCFRSPRLVIEWT